MMFHDTIKHDFCNLTAFPLVLDKTEMLGSLCQGRIAIIYTFCPLLRILGRLCDIVEDEVLKVLLHPMSILKSVDHRQKEIIGVWQNVLPVSGLKFMKQALTNMSNRQSFSAIIKIAIKSIWLC